MKKKNKIVYVAFAADILHKGHINILKRANKFGDVTVGLLTDKAIASYKKLPHLNYHQRELVLKNIRYVKKVIPQDTRSYKNNLIKIGDFDSKRVNLLDDNKKEKMIKSFEESNRFISKKINS